MKCPVCESDSPSVFFEMDDVPLFCNILCSTKDYALAVQKGDIKLAFCGDCMHVYNSDFKPELLDYTPEYENSLHFSNKFQDYASSLANTIVEKYNIQNKSVIDVGCGQGDFLKMVCDVGNNKGFGFDPSFRDEKRQDGSISADLEIIKDYYSPKYSNYSADLLCCRHVLEHIFEPGQFMQSIRTALQNRKDAVLFFEVPNVLYTLRDMGIWDLIYEHYSYFNSFSITNLFKCSGFEVLDTYETFAGQFLCIEARLTDNSQSSELMISEDISNYVSLFQKQYAEKKDSFAKQLSEIKENNLKAVLWGAGSKGVTFLNTFKIKDEIQYIVDINPRKQGMFVAGTGQKIISPDFLREFKPDVIFIMNAIYRNEIQKMMDEFQIDVKFLTV